ncbi:MAG: hypothetical protein J6Y55_07915 [Bacteroidales bacterium]|nr:hypothetical protein [Bacteroidales bacterium]
MDKFLNKVFEKYFENITDKIFQFIQSDTELMQDYLKLVESKGRDTVNRNLGKKIKEKLGLDAGKSGNVPQGTLIQSYTELKQK